MSALRNDYKIVINEKNKTVIKCIIIVLLVSLIVIITSHAVLHYVQYFHSTISVNQRGEKYRYISI